MKRFSRAFSKLALLGSIALIPALVNADYYAELREVKGEWRIRNISTGHTESLNQVNLTRGVPVSQRSTFSCTRGALGLTGFTNNEIREKGRDCSAKDFEESSIDYGSLTWMVPLGWPMGLVLSPLMMVASLSDQDVDAAFVFFLPMPIEIKQDLDFLQEALDEAYKNEGGRARFRKAFTRLNNLRKEAVSAQLSNSSLESAKVIDDKEYYTQMTSMAKMVEENINGITSRLNNTKVRNASGFGLSESKKDLFEVRSLNKPKNLHYAEPLLKKLISLKEAIFIWSSGDISSFEQKIERIEEQMPSWIEENAKRYKQNKQIKIDSDRKNEDVYHNALKSLPHFDYKLSISSNGTLERKLRNQGVQFKFEYPKSASGKVGALKLDGAKPKLTILSKNFENLYPQDDLVIDNSDIRVSLNNGFITIKNKTKSYVTLDALSLYHNSDVLTLGGNNFENYHEVAPEAETRLSLSAFNLRSLSDDYYAMTKVKAKKIKVSFGLAGKYRVTGRSDRKSFYKKKDYRLDKLIARYRNEPIRL